ncbi:Potassium transport protein [Mycena chlorophos]|uniref:Potassium transport protein n=1 Tax=Mycena chlorophos TaxID=658473 RepID=A0A8H6SEE5_MYCCL|nr:Potassium transport protein [Mycena chlorophos]
MSPTLNLRTVRKHLNFYRVHILFFTFTPLIFSGIFFASNGQYHISYVDSLFLCVSAMTVCGLATVDLSSLTGFQQALLFFQMCIGSPVVVSWVTVCMRKYYFSKKFEHIVKARSARNDPEKTSSAWPLRVLSRKPGLSTVDEMSRDESRESPSVEEEERPKKKKGFMKKLRPDMIRRTDNAPQLVNPSGWISEGAQTPMPSPIPPPLVEIKVAPAEPEEDDAEEGGPESEAQYATRRPRRLTFTNTLVSSPEPITPEPRSPSSDSNLRTPRARRLSDPGRTSPLPSPPVTPSFPRSDTVGASYPRTQTIEFAPDALPRRTRLERPHPEGFEYEPSIRSRRSGRRNSFHRQESYLPAINAFAAGKSIKHSGFGGFPMPHEIIKAFFSRFFPKLQRKLSRTVTIPAITHQISEAVGSTAPYISFDAIIGRNSAFRQLTREQQDELGGVEYRALKALLWIVPGYHFGIQLTCFAIIAPYMAQSRWREDFIPPMQHKRMTSSWFSAFQVVSAYTNTGMSLVDQSMVPFQQAYAMIVFMAVLVLAGNTAFPIFLRLTIWILWKLVPEKSRARTTLRFLLDHPRRCFIYLFPSHQTAFLLTVVFMLNLTDWFFFLTLDIGNPAIDTIPLHTRFAIGLLQATSVRAAGFGTVSLSALAPAVKVLYCIMMYVSVYPIAMSVRSTNVYEEQSLGIFQDAESDDEDEFEHHKGSRITVWSRYLAMHARKQLAFDMWYLMLAVFLVCIIERDNLDNEANTSWFNIFSVVFELVSAYGTVGLSLGSPNFNFSFSGTWRPLSKLIACLVMLRGRHRGLPVAIDRAVLLPMEFSESRDISQHDLGADLADASGNEKRPQSLSDERESRLRRAASRRSSEEISLSAARNKARTEDTSLRI